MILTIFGQPAITLAMLSNRIPEVLEGTTWKAAKSVTAAQRKLADGSATVRLRADPRLVAEDILRSTDAARPPEDRYFLHDWLMRWSKSPKLDERQSAGLTMLAEAIITS